MTELATLNRAMLQPDGKRAAARLKAAQAHGGRIKEAEVYELACEVMHLPGLRDLKKFKDLMKKADGSTADYGSNELASMAVVCLRAATTRNDTVGATARSLLLGLAVHPRAPHMLRESGSTLPNSANPVPLEFDPAPPEGLAAAKKNFDAVRASGNHNNIGQHALPYVETLEGSEKSLAKACQLAQAQLEKQERVSRVFAWACLRQRPNGLHYEDFPTPSAVVAIAFDLHAVGWPDLEAVPLTPLLDLILGTKATVEVKLQELSNLEVAGLKAEIESAFAGSRHTGLTYYHGLVTGASLGTGSMSASALAQALLREFHWLESGMEASGADQ